MPMTPIRKVRFENFHHEEEKNQLGFRSILCPRVQTSKGYPFRAMRPHILLLSLIAINLLLLAILIPVGYYALNLHHARPLSALKCPTSSPIPIIHDSPSESPIASWAKENYLRHAALLAEVSTRLGSRVDAMQARATEYQQRYEEYIRPLNADLTTQLVCLKYFGGGLGNYMFGMAGLMAIARRNNRVPVLIKDDNRSSVFQGPLEHLPVITEAELTGGRNLSRFTLYPPDAAMYDPRSESLDENQFAGDAVYLEGYFQSWMYFDEYRDDIRAMFTFKHLILLTAKTVIEGGLASLPASAFSSVPTLVGIHVRLGDILAPWNVEHGHLPAPDQYLLRMALHYQKKYQSVVFVVVSNDIPYCRQLFTGDNFVFITKASSPEVDMTVMSLMDQVIMSVGSFSYWSAYMNDRATEVSYFKNWPVKGTEYEIQLDPVQYFLPSWHGRE